MSSWIFDATDYQRLPAGPLDAITDVPGVAVGHTTLIEEEGALQVGYGPVRTGVTVVNPRQESIFEHPFFAGSYCLNGNGEVTGLSWLRESGLLTSPIALTNSHSAGVVRDALIRWQVEQTGERGDRWLLPVVGETWDGILNDINGMHVTADHVFAAMDSAAAGSFVRGNVGGGTGMICHEFKGGIGTSSRQVHLPEATYTLGVLVQANHGRRSEFLPGQLLPATRQWLEQTPRPNYPAAPAGAGSILVVLATDAPMLPHQLDRLAKRASLGIARTGGTGEHGSGDFVLSFSTGNHNLSGDYAGVQAELQHVSAVPNSQLDPLFDAAIEATAAAILDCLTQAETMVGRDGFTAWALPELPE